MRIEQSVDFRDKVAQRVTAQLAAISEPGTRPDAITSIEVWRALYEDSIHADLIREIAEQVAAEMGGKA